MAQGGKGPDGLWISAEVRRVDEFRLDDDWGLNPGIRWLQAERKVGIGEQQAVTQQLHDQGLASFGAGVMQILRVGIQQVGDLSSEAGGLAIDWLEWQAPNGVLQESSLEQAGSLRGAGDVGWVLTPQPQSEQILEQGAYRLRGG